MYSYVHRFALASLVAVIACDPGQSTTTTQQGGGGKADDNSEGEGEGEELCSAEMYSAYGTDLANVDAAAVDEWEYTRADLDGLNDLEKEQIIAAATVGVGSHSYVDIEQAFGLADGGTFRFQALDLRVADVHLQGTAVTYKLEGVDYGAIFTPGHTIVEAEIAAGKIHGCEYELPPLEKKEVTCEPDSFFAASAEELRQHIVDTVVYTRADKGSIEELEARQMFEAVLFWEYARASQSPDAVFDIVDGGELKIHRLEFEVADAPVDLDWVEYKVDGYPLGVAFVSRNLTPQLANEDDSLLHCTVVESAN